MSVAEVDEKQTSFCTISQNILRLFSIPSKFQEIYTMRLRIRQNRYQKLIRMLCHGMLLTTGLLLLGVLQRKSLMNTPVPFHHTRQALR